jgi:succinoglycan biosynthesis transport protein ExoP
MNEVLKFLNLLQKYRLTLIVVPIITIIVTYFLVRNLPSSYISQAQVATGIVDDTQLQSVLLQAAGRDEASQKFSNLMEGMKMNKVLDQVSFQLIVHDLTANQPYKKSSKEVKDLNPSARRHALMVFREKYHNRSNLTLSIPDQNGLYNVIKSMGYDADALRSKLTIYRPGDSDYIVVQFESENPNLSAFVVNTLSSEFISKYEATLKNNQVKANTFLGKLLHEKSDTLANRMSQLRNYKIKNGVINLPEQSKQLYELLLQYDTKKQEAIEKTSSYAGALNQIDRKFDSRDRAYVEAALSKVNQAIVNTKAELSSVYNLYINNDLDEKYKKSYDSLSNKLTEQINKSSDQYITNPLNTKQELITQKLNLEIQLDLSRYSINSLEKKIQTLNQQLNRLVPKDADITSLDMNIDIASKEYLDILNKYNQSSLESSFSTKMNIAQLGVPGLAQPSKKMLLVILSSLISIVFCVLIIFILYFFDDSITSVKELANVTDLPVIGIVSKIITPTVDLSHLWEQDPSNLRLSQFKNQLRSIRYDIDQEIDDRILIITSIDPSEGKTLLALSLAFAWKMTNKRILLIDGNFSNPTISAAANSKVYLEDFFTGKSQLPTNTNSATIDILSNKGGDTSLLELATADEIKSKLDWAKTHYDLILIESAALGELNQSKEWILFGSNIVGVFEASSIINESKKDYISYLKETKTFIGWILNKA